MREGGREGGRDGGREGGKEGGREGEKRCSGNTPHNLTWSGGARLAAWHAAWPQRQVAMRLSSVGGSGREHTS